MAVDSSFEIPTVDIGPYLRDPSSQASAKIIEDVRRACMTTGFFLLVGHGISKELQQSVIKASETLFALPLEEKKRLVSPKLANRGYEIIGAQTLQEGCLPDLKEGFYISLDIPDDDERAKKHPALLGPNIFPGSIPATQLREPTEAYYKELVRLTGIVMEILAKGLPFADNVFDEFLSNDPICVLRLLHYPAQTSQNPRQLGAGAHTDFGAVTLLMQDGTPGLEVLDAATGAWVGVDANPDAYVVNIGDMLALWTGGRYRSGTHRVRNLSGTDRYSVPFFVDGNADARLAPLDGSPPSLSSSSSSSSLEKGEAQTVAEHMLERYGRTYGNGSKAGVPPVEAGV